MTTDYASNGSLYLYANKRFNLYTETLAGLAPPDDFSYPAAVAKLWREEVLFIFSGLVRAVEFMHSKGVCHLGLDVHTIVIDSSGNPIIVDFGSSEVAEADGFVGRGRSILCKPHYRAPEVHNHNHNPKGSPGVNGRAADMYSLGLYWLLFIYPPRGNIIIDPVTQHGQWRHHLFQHLEQDFADHDEDTCVFQFHDPLDRNIAQILEGLLQTQPESRTKACELRENIEGYNYQIQDDTRTRCQALVEEFLSIAADES
ncbi:hypothetical protein Poli38472_008713 [Pythium oligandrum]|uniref:non-specific serine/threonine protein kinase n=1 Tax=Pythium oligandrum TaxID=41045 RepID=A0A8K1C429_PYTOL|nr:hypothetical protein Poli38472_008713 [Pythium oligandrum]|eukprot:TMW56065.1 hypothetical protein Poli38472_008713 [Pythium oligandrum]